MSESELSALPFVTSLGRTNLDLLHLSTIDYRMIFYSYFLFFNHNVATQKVPLFLSMILKKK